jgi:hypothetical protein
MILNSPAQMVLLSFSVPSVVKIHAEQSQSSRLSQGNETVSGAEPVRRALDVVAEVSDGGLIADFSAVAQEVDRPLQSPIGALGSCVSS